MSKSNLTRRGHFDDEESYPEAEVVEDPPQEVEENDPLIEVVGELGSAIARITYLLFK